MLIEMTFTFLMMLSGFFGAMPSQSQTFDAPNGRIILPPLPKQTPEPKPNDRIILPPLPKQKP